MKTLTLFQILPFIPLFFLLGSCSSYKFYSPNDANMMTLKKRNDAQVSVSTGIFNKAYDFQAGYSPIKFIRLSGSYFGRHDVGSVNNQIEMRGHGRMWAGEIGAYYFLKIGAQYDEKYDYAYDSGILLDIQQGIGRGKINTNFSEKNSISTTSAISPTIPNTYSGARSFVSLFKNYRQVGLHFIHKNIELGTAVRFIQLDYDRANLTGEFNDDMKNSLTPFEENNEFTARELTTRLAWYHNDLKFYFHYTKLDHDAVLDEIGTYDTNFGIGLIMNINQISLRKY